MVGLRDQLNQKPLIAAGIVVAMILSLVVIFFSYLHAGRPSALSGVQFYYTTDNGKTWFAEASEKVPPFDHDGAQAVRCYVFKTASSGPFAGYLETYTQAVHDYLTGVVKSPIPLDATSGTLVRRPGDRIWALAVSPAGQKIKDVKAPNGSTEPVEPVFP